MPKQRSAAKKNRSFSYKFVMLMAFSDTYFPKVSAHVSLKVATKDSLRDQETMKI